jgi:glycosyltransferase involved in cell wall biosynthesis
MSIETRPASPTIMHLTSSSFYSGPDKQIVEHLKRLNKQRYRGIVATFVERGLSSDVLGQANQANIEHYTVPVLGPLDFRAPFKLIRLLRGAKVDLLCTHGYKPTVLGWLAAQRLRLPVIAFSRGYTTETIRVAFYECLERQILTRVSGIVFVSEGQKRRLESFGIRAKRSWVVYNAVSAIADIGAGTAEIRRTVFRKLNIPEYMLMVVSAGRLSPEKGHRYLIEAIEKMGERANDAAFVFCGDGRCRKALEDQCRRLKIDKRCWFAGFRQDMNEIFRAMDLLVLPSLTEGLPNVVLEAFAHSRPVVATEVGGVPEIVEHEQNGLLVPPGHADSLAGAITKLIASPNLRKKMGQEGHRTVGSKFTFEEQTRRLEAIYTEVLNGLHSI